MSDDVKDTGYFIKEYMIPIKDTLLKNTLAPISHSKLSTLLSCPKAFDLTYKKKEKRKEPEDVIDTNVGSFIHEFLERAVPALWTNNKANRETDLDLIWANVLKGKTKRPLTSLELLKADGMRDNTYNIAHKIVNMINKDNLYVEVEYFVGINSQLNSYTKGSYLNTLINGYIDLLGISDNGHKCLLIDYKTYAQGDETDAKVREQLEIYAILLMLKYKHINEIEAGVAYIPDDLVVTTTIYRNELEDMLKRYTSKLNNAVQVLKTELGVPKPGIHCKWCYYQYMCTSKK